MSFGLDENGFTPKTTDDILASLRTKLKALFGEEFAADLDTSVVGQFIGVFTGELADLWNAAQAVWRSRYPSLATGVSLDAVAEETGAVRLAAARSTVDLTWSGDDGTVIPVGTIARVASSDARFRTTVEGVIASGSVTVATESIDFGPILGPSGTIDDIVTPISGVDSVTNALDADVGRDIETDADFRIRRQSLLREQGEATIGAIRSDLLALDDVDEVRMFNNPSNSTDGDGLPPHSFEAVVRGGDDDEIAAEIFDSQPAGIESYGTETAMVEDENGDSQTVKYSRPVDVNMYAEIEVTTDDSYPDDGDDQIKQAIVDYWLAFDQRIGKDVITNAFYGAVYAISGVTQVTTLEIDDTIPTTGTATTVIPARSIAVFDTSRITVTS